MIKDAVDGSTRPIYLLVLAPSNNANSNTCNLTQSTAAGNLTPATLNLNDVVYRKETEIDMKLQAQQKTQPTPAYETYNNLNQFIRSNDLEYTKKILSADSSSPTCTSHQTQNNTNTNNSFNETNESKNSIDFAIDAVLAKCNDDERSPEQLGVKSVPTQMATTTSVMNSPYDTIKVNNNGKQVSNAAIQILPNLPQITILNSSLTESQLIQIEPSALAASSSPSSSTTSTTNFKSTHGHLANVNLPSKSKTNKTTTNSSSDKPKSSENVSKKKRNGKKGNGETQSKQQQQQQQQQIGRAHV